MKKTKDQIKQWMISIRDEQGISFQQWAERAGVAPTTLTEFVNGKRDFIPSSKTLARLAEAVGQTLTFSSDHTQAVRNITLYTSDHAHDDLTPTDPVQIPIKSEGEFALLVEAPTLQDAGILVNDVLVCTREPSTNASSTIAVAMTDHGLSPYLLIGPQLIPACSTGDYTPLPLEDAEIQGYAVQLLRNL